MSGPSRLPVSAVSFDTCVSFELLGLCLTLQELHPTEPCCVHRRMDSIIATSSQPHPDQPPLSFEAPYAQGIVAQYVICVRKFFITFWRNPEYAHPLLWAGFGAGHAELLSCTAHCNLFQ